jgi:hypothetical protein
MRDTPLSLDEMRERLHRSQEEARELIAESRALRLTLRELVDRSRREREERLRCMVLPQPGQTGFAGGRETGSRATPHPQCVNHDCTFRCDCGEEADYLMRGATRPSLARCRAHTNPHAFDLLELGGKDLRRTPLEERKRALANWFAKLPGRCN